MPVDVVTTYLEMTSPDDLRAGRLPPAPVELAQVDSSTSAALLRSTYTRVGQPWGWPNVTWSEQQWEEWLGRHERQRWIVRLSGEAAGLVEIEAQPEDHVEIVIFGLFPEFAGKGFGGHVLTLAVERAWNAEHDGGGSTRRVWLHTATHDHPRALPNYLSRGFRPFRVEHEQREVAE